VAAVIEYQSFSNYSGMLIGLPIVSPMLSAALSGNPVISVMVSWMCNNTKDVKTAIDNTLRVSLAFAPLR